MSQTLFTEDPCATSIHEKYDRQGHHWKKNLDGDIDHFRDLSSEKLSSGTGISILSRPEQDLVPDPISEGMNHRHHHQQMNQNITSTNNVSSSNGNDNMTLTAIPNQPSLAPFNLNSTVTSMLVPNSSHNSNDSQVQQSQGNASSIGGRSSVPQIGNNTAWLQHMILNPINPLHGNSNSSSIISNGLGDNVRSARNQGAVSFTQQELQGNTHGNTDSYAGQHRQMPNQAEDTTIGATSLSKQQEQGQQLTSFQAQQDHHQQQTIQQGLQLNQLLSLQQQHSLNEAIPQLPLPTARLTPQLQQQQQTGNINVQPASSMQQQQQQQQLLLLTLMLQQNNASNNLNLDSSALSSALASPEGMRLLNSILLGQQSPPSQENQVQQQQLSAGFGSAPSSSSLGLDQLPQVSLPGVDEDTLSNQQPSLLSQQMRSQSQQLNGIQIPSMPAATSSLDPNWLGKVGDLSVGSTAMNQHYIPQTDDHSLSNTGIVSARNGIALSSLAIPVDPLSSGSKTERDSIKFPTKNDRQSKSGNNGKTTAKSRFPKVLYCDSDDAILGEYQTLLRQQLELFEADSHDVINGTFRQGRTTPIRLGQIGLRCKHCAKAPLSVRTKGSVYFSQTIKGMYQIGQNMSKVHLCERCPRIPPDIKKRMIALRSRRHRASGGRAYWIRHLREMGIYEDGTVLRAHPVQERKRSSDGKKAANKK